MSRFATLDSIKKGAEKREGQGGAPGGEGGEEGGPDANDYYVGGNSARGGGSGLSVVGPPSSGGDGDLVAGIFNRARGAPEGGVPPEMPPGGSAGMRTITMYRNGFTVDDGPFRALEDPANEAFLRDLARGVVPRELEAGVPQGEAVHVNLKDKRDEDYSAPPAPAYVAYSGEGKAAGAREASADAVVAGGAGGGEPAPEVDESKPTTTLQIVLHDGRRVQRKFNLSNTLRHVQGFIAAEGAGGAAYRLLEGFPPRELTDFGRTLEAAGLKNARITQKLV